MKNNRFILFGIPALVLALFGAVSYGSIRIPLADVMEILLRGDGGSSWDLIIWKIRLPRVLCAALVGGILAIGGVTCQGLFRNPLSEPYLLGISSGAALGAAIAILLSPLSGRFGLGILGIFAFSGAMLVTMMVFLAAGRGAFRFPSTLLLSGIAIALVCQAIIWLLMALNHNQIEKIVFWTLGSLSSARWEKVLWLSVTTIPSAIVLVGMGRMIDVLSTGYESAHGMGVKPQRSASIVLAITSFGTSAAVAVSGNIGFVGLMIPHIARFLGGPSHRNLIINSWIGGAILLVLADFAARMLNPPSEIPLGIVTALLGAPFLLFLVRGKRGEGRLDG
ncbi:hypothetical protein S1OALGB6SA_1486 [Olavius algarvensis spirochete endosymbiont]|uniref:FecCD family ABC transporter permease n=1 Tax=Olavius algarvensis spirochete endosymbiont TaxID=260710 RepID=UPI000689DA46|nr:iron ABC transporter permease [Olavius algarvensis spirochete endosymbiont]VDB00408.1 hypothetical protein S1OALGB6SA_1486 [Olavius algarvensis spirochete endosymbiont]